MSGFGFFSPGGFGSPGGLGVPGGCGEFLAAAARANAQQPNDLDLQAREPKGVEPVPRDALVLSLDLGQRKDYSALICLHRRKDTEHFDMPLLIRWDLGTSYVQILEDVCDYVQRAHSAKPPYSTVLLVDSTGCGIPVVDQFKRKAVGGELPGRLIPILIVSGTTQSEDEYGCFHVPKSTLVSSLRVLLDSRRLHIDPRLPLAKVLRRELQMFTAKVSTAGNLGFEAWRDRDKDDCVLATAQAAWFVLRQRRQPAFHFGGSR